LLGFSAARSSHFVKLSSYLEAPTDERLSYLSCRTHPSSGDSPPSPRRPSSCRLPSRSIPDLFSPSTQPFVTSPLLQPISRIDSSLQYAPLPITQPISFLLPLSRPQLLRNLSPSPLVASPLRNNLSRRLLRHRHSRRKCPPLARPTLELSSPPPPFLIRRRRPLLWQLDFRSPS
jgi:hypothetical protein